MLGVNKEDWKSDNGKELVIYSEETGYSFLKSGVRAQDKTSKNFEGEYYLVKNKTFIF
jgi:hypothetical protein